MEKTPAEVRPLLEEELVKAFPNINKNWSDLKCQKWRFSQVTKAYTGTPGYVVLHEDPLLIGIETNNKKPVLDFLILKGKGLSF